MTDTTTKTAPQIARRANGANALKELLKSIQDVSNATVLRDGEEADGRDYKTITAILDRSITCNVCQDELDPTSREGYLRALADILCMCVDGVLPDLAAWDPIQNTAMAFEGGRPHMRPENKTILVAARKTRSDRTALDLRQIENKSLFAFERLMMLQELVQLAIDSLPNSTDSDVPIALLSGMQAMLIEDTAAMHLVSESVSVIVEQSAGATT